MRQPKRLPIRLRMRLPMRLPTRLPKLTRLNMILLGLAVVAVSFLISLKLMDLLSPRDAAPALTELPPLPQVARSSFVVAPIAVALSAIREIADRGAPRNFAGKVDNPAAQVLQNAERAPLALGGPAQALDVQSVILVSAVRKVQARDIHAEAEEIAHGGFGIAGGADGTDDFRPPRSRSSRNLWG